MLRLTPQEIEGWMDEPELAWLQEQAKDRSLILEIGSWKGRSTMALYNGMDEHCKIYCVDTWRGTVNEGEVHDIARRVDDPVYREFVQNHQEGISNGKVKPFRVRSTIALNIFAGMGLKFDMIFIDADHSYQGCRSDIVLSKKVLATGGLLCGHDWGYDIHHDGGPKRAAMEIGGYPVGAGSIWRA